jgi:hypothetical protein
VNATKRKLTDYSKEQKDYLIERAKFAENDAKVLDEMADELRSLNFAIEACGHDGKIEYEKACFLATSVVKIAANYLSRCGGGEL